MAEKRNKGKTKERENPVQKMDGNSYSPQQELLELLRTKSPEVFTEGKVDVRRLRQTLGEEVASDGESYGLSWAGKSDFLRHIKEPTTATLRPQRKEGNKSLNPNFNLICELCVLCVRLLLSHLK